MFASKIGIFDFVSMQPPPPGKRYVGFTEMRSGVDGHAFWREAVRGVPWTTRTFRDTADFASANALFRLYESYVLVGTHLLTWGGIVAPASEPVVILDVKPISIQQVASSVGGLYPGSRGFVIAEWTLVAVEVSQ
jgi:hypothetical protein